NLTFPLQILLVETTHSHCREQHNSTPAIKTERHGGLRLRKLTLQKEQARLLRRLILETTQFSKRNIERQRWTSYDNDDWVNFDEFETGFHPYTSAFPSQAKKPHKRLDTMIDSSSSKSCCPQRFEIIEPNYGRNRTGHIVELYRDDRIKQRFYELICDRQIANAPCRFLQGRNQKLSKCTQQHVYSYALIQSNQSLSGWSLDHIRIRSACTCNLYQPSDTRKKKNSRWEFN
ncbi:Neurotrophin-3, partial [Folsomia candida]